MGFHPIPPNTSKSPVIGPLPGSGAEPKFQIISICYTAKPTCGFLTALHLFRESSNVSPLDELPKIWYDIVRQEHTKTEQAKGKCL